MKSTNNPRSFKLSSNSKVAMHTDSRTINPKVRIIHIFAPEIIKTDAANFRELVQRLTGKPPETDLHRPRVCRKTPSKKLKSSRFSDADYRQGVMEQVMKDDDEMMIWGGDQKSELFNGFADLNGFVNEFRFDASTSCFEMDNVFEEIM